MNEEVRIKEYIEQRSKQIDGSLKRLDKFHQRIMLLFSDIGLKIKENALTIDENKLSRTNKDLIAPMLILKLEKESKTINEFFEQLNKNLQIMMNYTPELATQIKSINLSDEINDETILARIKTVLEHKNKEEVFEHFEKYSDFYHKTLITMRNKKLSEELISKLSALNGTEIKFLESEIKGLKKSKLNTSEYIEFLEEKLVQKYRLRDSVLLKKLNQIKGRDMLIDQKQMQELKGFYKEIESWSIDGNNFEIYRKRTLELLIYFTKKYNKNKLIKSIMGTKQGKLFLRYNKLYNHVLGQEHWDIDKFAKKGIRGVVDATYKDEKGNWEHFIPLVKNVNKEAEYILKTFGDELVANEIKNIANTCKEGTKCWLDHLNALETNVIRNSERLRSVLEVVQKILLNFIKNNIKQLGKELESDKERIKSIFLDRIRDLKKGRNGLLRRMGKIIDNSLVKLRKEPELLKSSLIQSAVKFRNTAIIEFAEHIKKVNDKIGEAGYIKKYNYIKEKAEESLDESILKGLPQVINNQLKWNDYIKKGSMYLASKEKTNYSILMNIAKGMNISYQAEKTKNQVLYEFYNKFMSLLKDDKVLKNIEELQKTQESIIRILEWLKNEKFTQTGEA